MRPSSLIMLGLAVLFGLGAVFLANAWLSRQAALARRHPTPAIATETLVVASAPLRYGMQLSAADLREIQWPAATLPTGAFRSISDVLGGGKRVVLAAIEPNEPILRSKITGPGQRGTLSALINDGRGAVTIQVNEVLGVGGFVLAGDRVDILLTRKVRSESAPEGPPVNVYTDMILQNMRVLAAGQMADERSEKPAIVNAVTLEADAVEAQKLALAASVGTLSLRLRKSGESEAAPTHRVTLGELGDGGPHPSKHGATAVVRVMHGSQREEYSVPTEGAIAVGGRPEPERQADRQASLSPGRVPANEAPR